MNIISKQNIDIISTTSIGKNYNNSNSNGNGKRIKKIIAPVGFDPTTSGL